MLKPKYVTLQEPMCDKKILTFFPSRLLVMLHEMGSFGTSGSHLCT